MPVKSTLLVISLSRHSPVRGESRETLISNRASESPRGIEQNFTRLALTHLNLPREPRARSDMNAAPQHAVVVDTGSPDQQSLERLGHADFPDAEAVCAAR